MAENRFLAWLLITTLGWSSTQMAANAQTQSSYKPIAFDCSNVICPNTTCGIGTINIPNPGECCSFCRCSPNGPIMIPCPSGLHYNNETELCDWPHNCGCEENLATGKPVDPIITNTTPAAPTTAQTFTTPQITSTIVESTTRPTTSPPNTPQPATSPPTTTLPTTTAQPVSSPPTTTQQTTSPPTTKPPTTTQATTRPPTTTQPTTKPPTTTQATTRPTTTPQATTRPTTTPQATTRPPTTTQATTRPPKTTTRVPTTLPSRPVCRNVVCRSWFICMANPNDCNSYCECEWGIPYLIRCPSGLYYSSYYGVCTYRRYSDCGLAR